MPALLGVVVRHERRVRLRFEAELRASAFQSTRFYSAACKDGRAVSPTVVGALAVGADLHEVELALGSDLVSGALYAVTVVGLPTADGPLDASAVFRVGEPTVSRNRGAQLDDLDALIYGVDLVHDGVDYVESADGDLASIGGLPNAEGAVRRRLLASGLPWDPTYGTNPRRFVDGTSAALPPLRASLIREALKDDRVTAADATLAPDGVFDVELTPIGVAAPSTIRIPVQTS